MRIAALLTLALAATACSKKGADAGAVKLETEDQKIVYALGLSEARNLKAAALTPEEIKFLQAGIADGLAGTPQLKIEEFGPKISPFVRKRQTAAAETEKTKGKAYADKAAGEPGAVAKPSGLVYQELKAGEGAQPVASDTVRVHYKGTLIDGSEFDSSYSRNEPATFPLGNVIPCWTEGLQLMKVGGKAKLVCPASIAYGDFGRPKIPGGSTLVFEVELLEIMAPPAAPVPMPAAPPEPSKSDAPAKAEKPSKSSKTRKQR